MSHVRFLLLLLFAFSPALFGQATARLTGAVVDSSGAAVPAAEITVFNIETGTERKATASETGDFTFPSLSPGDYTVTVSKSGFRQAKREGIRLEVNQTARLDFTLELGAVTETVQVTGGQSYPMEVLIGEWPGGDFKAYLMIQKEGVEYEKDAKGNPILPIFKVASGQPQSGGEAPVFAKSGPVWKAEKPKEDTASAGH